MIKLVAALLILSSCQSYNSHTGDAAKYAKVELENNPQFQEAYQVIQNRCVNCHQSEHNIWATYVNSQMWVDKGLVVRGDAQGSLLVRRIINSNHTSSNMPPSGPLPNDEYQVIVDWINGL